MSGSMTSAVAPLGRQVSPTSARTSSVWSWIAASSVSRTFAPSSVRLTSSSSSVSPSASLTRRRSPSWPRRSRVQAVLEAGEAGAVGADVAQQLGGHPRARVVAVVLRDELEALDAELARALGAAHRDLLGEVDEAGVVPDELLEDVLLRLAERAGQLPGGLVRAVDQVRRRGDRHRRMGDGELVAVRVGDRAAAGGDDEVVLLLRDRGLLQRVRRTRPSQLARPPASSSMTRKTAKRSPIRRSTSTTRPGPPRRWPAAAVAAAGSAAAVGRHGGIGGGHRRDRGRAGRRSSWRRA